MKKRDAKYSSKNEDQHCKVYAATKKGQIDLRSQSIAEQDTSNEDGGVAECLGKMVDCKNLINSKDINDKDTMFELQGRKKKFQICKFKNGAIDPSKDKMK